MPRLSVDVEARLARFEAGIKNMESTVQRAAGAMSSALGAIGVGISAAGLSAFVKQSIDAADNLGKLAQRVGVTVESLSALEYAGKLADVSTEQLGDALKKLSVNLQEGAAGSKELRAAFAAVGIGADELGRIGADEALGRIAQAFAQAEDGAGKTALAVKLFGRAGSDLIPLLNAGRQGLAAAADEAQRFGLIVSTEAAKAAESFNDNLTRLQEQSRALSIRVANDLLPTLTKFAQTMVDSAAAAGSFGEGLIRSLFGQGRDVKSELAQIENQIRAVRQERDKLRGSAGDSAFARAIPGLSRVADLEEQENRLRLTRDYLKRLQEIRLSQIRTGEASTLDARDLALRQAPRAQLALPAATSPDGAEDALAVRLARGNERMGRYLAQIQLDQLDALTKKGREIEDNLLEQFEEGQRLDERLARDYKTRLEAVLGDTRLGQQQRLADDLQVVNEAFEQGAISAEQLDSAYARLRERANSIDGLRQVGDDAERQAQNFRDLETAIRGWGNAFNESLVQGLKRGRLEVSSLIDAIITDIARLALSRGITQPLFGAVSNLATFAFGGQGAQQNPNYFQFGKPRAMGGPVEAGALYRVGETGSEWFVPSRDGTIIPGASASAQSGATVVLNINVPTDGALIRAATAQGIALANAQLGRAARIGALS